MWGRCSKCPLVTRSSQNISDSRPRASGINSSPSSARRMTITASLTTPPALTIARVHGFSALSGRPWITPATGRRPFQTTLSRDAWIPGMRSDAITVPACSDCSSRSGHGRCCTLRTTESQKSTAFGMSANVMTRTAPDCARRISTPVKLPKSSERKPSKTAMAAGSSSGHCSISTSMCAKLRAITVVGSTYVTASKAISSSRTLMRRKSRCSSSLRMVAMTSVFSVVCRSKLRMVWSFSSSFLSRSALLRCATRAISVRSSPDSESSRNSRLRNVARWARAFGKS
mmetsp:Transcript_25498/g.78704  ORF Transcript_25498/g.78704 Transcript_25498/m.78704 type:complete len:286 (+) Transcript_25498:1784-2641(+)